MYPGPSKKRRFPKTGRHFDDLRYGSVCKAKSQVPDGKDTPGAAGTANAVPAFVFALMAYILFSAPQETGKAQGASSTQAAVSLRSFPSLPDWATVISAAPSGRSVSA